MKTGSTTFSHPARLIIALLAIGAVVWLGLGTADRLRTAFVPPAPEPVPPRTVETMVAEPRTFERWQRYPGSIAAESEAVLSSRIYGIIRAMPFRAGDRVEAGDVLITLTDEELRRELDRLDYEIEATLAELELARRQLERREQLHAEDAITREALEESQTRTKTLAASLAANRQAREAAAERLDYTRIRAPFAGLVGRLHALPGDLASPGQPLLELVAVDQLKAEFVLPQSDLAGIGPGTPLRIKVAAVDRQWDNTLDRLHPDLKPPGRGARAETLLPAKAAGLLRPGMTASVKVLVHHRENSLVIPVEALYQRRGQAHVFIVDNGRARSRPVRPGPEADGWVVIDEGLTRGEQVITGGYPGLADGDPVQIVNVYGPENQPANKTPEPGDPA